MPRQFRTVRELIYWEYAKLIAGSAVNDRKAYSFVNFTYRRLVSEHLTPTDIVTENKALFSEGDTCAYCGNTSNLHWEHIIPRSKGGPESFDNLVRACESCNLSKAARDPYQWYAGEHIDNIPRVVLGKLLKLAFSAYSAVGVIDSEPYMAEHKVQRVSLCQIFKQSPGQSSNAA